MKHESPSTSTRDSIITRRNFLRGLGAAAAVAATPRVVSAAEDVLFISEEESKALAEKRIKRLRERYDREDRQVVEAAIAHNKAKLVKNVNTESGMKISVMQAQTGQNPDLLMLVDDQALSRTMNFLIGSMDEVNNKNGKPIDPKRIADVQERARAGKLDNIHMTVIMSGTGGFHSPDGVLTGGGATYNGHAFSEKDPRDIIRPLVCFSPDIYNPGREVMTPEAVIGTFPMDGDDDKDFFQPSGDQALSIFFAHEASHVLLDVLGTKQIADLAELDPNIDHDAGQYEHKAFVSPLNWLHTAAVAGLAVDQPALAPSFIVPKLSQ